MQRFVINGGFPLNGDIQINGAKNAILPILAASLLTEEECIFRDVPLLEDVFVMIDVLSSLGVDISWQDNDLLVQGGPITNPDLSEQLIKKMRASNLIMGPLLSRIGEVKMPYPGGCAIGSRPMNYHLQALSRLGISIKDQGSYIEAKTKNIQGGQIILDFPSVGATENAMMTAAAAKGFSVIRNAAKEPEIMDLADFINKMGGKIEGAGTDTIYIEGISKFHGTEHKVIRDRIEAGTLMMAAAITGGDVFLRDAKREHLSVLIDKMEECGMSISDDSQGLHVKKCRRLETADIKTMPYPGFPTDLQPQFMALMCCSKGNSLISETIFENRFRHVGEMRRMGADIKLLSTGAVVKGKDNLRGAVVEATDLRAGAALVLLALAAEGHSAVENIHYIDRGYENLEKCLFALGGDIRRVESEIISSEITKWDLCPCQI